ncbi:hypothetical protein HanIR_Chr15g0737671 [Helianthus annuus]|nr:hypothetical protein HanIR_Chr15g0737671 [Helianthus annuus]
MFPDLFSLEMKKKCTVADRINVQGVTQVAEWSWRTQIVSPVLLDSFGQLSSLIISVQLSSDKDRWKWAADSGGTFSVKSVKQLLIAEDNNGPGFILDWCKLVPAKCNIHVWRSSLNSIPTAEA